jgi:V/A-type H+-transporting ATPase subunit K
MNQMTLIQKKFRRKLIGFGVMLGFLIFAVLSFSVVKAIAQTSQEVQSTETTMQQPSQAESRMQDPGVIKFAFLAAAIAVGVGSLGAGAAVGYVGAAAMGTIGEKPELAGRALIFVGLAEGIAIYGLIIAIMILGKV